MQHRNLRLSHQGALTITLLALVDLFYRVMLRESVRRALGMRDN